MGTFDILGRPRDAAPTPVRVSFSQPSDPTVWGPGATHYIDNTVNAIPMDDIDDDEYSEDPGDPIAVDEIPTYRYRPDSIIDLPYNPDPDEEGGPVLSELTLPTGWKWKRTPDTSAGHVEIDERYVVWDGPATPGRATYAERLEGLRVWLIANHLKAHVYRSRDLQLTGSAGSDWALAVAQVHVFLVCTTRYWNYNHGDTDWVALQATRRACPDCNALHPAGTMRCPTTDMPTYCVLCGRESVGVRWNAAIQTWWCSTCAYSCVECGGEAPNGFEFCSDCRTLTRCTGCATREALAPGAVGEFVNGVCPVCIEHTCSSCSRVDRRHALQWSPADEQWLCRSCWRASLNELNEEVSDEDDDVQTILSIPGRENIRMCGIELEGANGLRDGTYLARELYREGLSAYDRLQGYHHGGGSFIHVEADSSVDWEVVMGPLNPADDDQMLAVNRAMRLIRKGIHSKAYKLDLRCGLHIHVGAEGFGLGQAYNLNTLFSYVEDVMFRLAAAKWPIHRSMTGSPYCQPVEKSTSKLAFGREVGQDESRDARRVALNFRNYFQRMLNNCSCGAVRFDSWENCTCDLGKCTFEFRLFNSTANPRKLHAYMALAQALVAKAGTLPEIENPQDDYPPHSFLAKPFKGMSEAEQEQSVEQWTIRLRWLLNELPLTDDERTSVVYCVRNSDLAVLGESVIDELATVTTTKEVTA